MAKYTGFGLLILLCVGCAGNPAAQPQPGPEPQPPADGRPADTPEDFPPGDPPRPRAKTPPDPAGFAGKPLAKWREDLRSKDTQTWFVALHVIRAFGPAAKDAAPDLLAPHFVFYPVAMDALVAIGEPALPALLDATRSPSEHTRVLAWETLARFGPAAAPVAPKVAERLADPDAVNRMNAARVLVKMDPTGKLAAPHLPALLKDADPATRSVAARALTESAPDTPGLAPILLEPFTRTGGKSSDRFFIIPERENLAALRKLGPVGARAAAEAAKGMDGIEAGRMLGKVFAEPFGGKEAVPALVELLTHTPPRNDNPHALHAGAAAALGRLGPDAAAAVPALLKALDDPHRPRGWIVEAIGDIGGDPKELIPVLRKWLDGPETAPFAAKSLGQVGRADPDAVLPILRPLVASPDPKVRVHAAGQLARLAPTAEDVYPALLDLAGDPYNPSADTKQRWAVPVAEKYLTTLPKECAPTLRKSLADPDARRRLHAARALLRIDAKDGEAIKALDTLPAAFRRQVAAEYKAIGRPGAVRLARMLKDPAATIDALAALREMKADAAGAAPVVRTILKDPDPVLRFRAAETLAAIDPDETTASPVLAELVKNPNTPRLTDLPTEQGPRVSRGDARAQVARLLLVIDVEEAARAAATVPGVFVP